MEKKRPLKTFGKRSAPAIIQPSADIQRSASIDSILGDENEELQAKINQVIQDDLAGSKKKEGVKSRSDFMDELDALSSDEEEELFMYGTLKASKTVKTVHELVEAGENSRFFDEIEYLVEGLRTGSTTSRLCSLDDLLAKVFSTPGFGGRMRAHGMLGRAIGYLMGIDDGRVREGVALLIIHLCHDIRKLDVFISVDKLCALASDLLQDANPVKGTYYLKQTPIFRDLSPTKPPTSTTLGLWLLAKLCQSMGQGASREEIQATRSCLAECHMEELLAEHLFDRESGIGADEVGCLEIRWGLVVLEFASPSVLYRRVFDLVRLLERIIEQSSQLQQGVLAATDLAKLLVSITGPDDQSLALSTSDPFTLLLFTFLLTILNDVNTNEHHQTVGICMISACINLVDRSESLRAKRSSYIPSLCTIFNGYTQCSRNHLGLLIALMMKENRSNQALVLEHADPGELCECVQSILTGHQTSGQLSPLISETLTGIIKDLESMCPK